MRRFISVIESPTRVWTDHLVIDCERCVVLAKCTNERHSDEICDALVEAEEKRKLAPKALLKEVNL